jgi:hypothetical protein
LLLLYYSIVQGATPWMGGEKRSQKISSSPRPPVSMPIM